MKRTMTAATRKGRMRRILAPDGRTLIVAMDHLSKLGRSVRMCNTGAIMREIRSAGADAVLLRPGLALRATEDLDRLGLVLSIGQGSHAPHASVELALRIGADAIKIEAFPGSPLLPSPTETFGPIVAACERWGLPLVAEMIPVSFEDTAAHTPEAIADVTRMGSDLGADIVKTKYTGDARSFAVVTALAEAPVVVLGGVSGSPTELFSMVRSALDVGASGAAVGRGIWQSENPGRLVAALARLIHDDISAEEAAAGLTRVSVAVGPR